MIENNGMQAFDVKMSSLSIALESTIDQYPILYYFSFLIFVVGNANELLKLFNTSKVSKLQNVSHSHLHLIWLVCLKSCVNKTLPSTLFNTKLSTNT